MKFSERKSRQVQIQLELITLFGDPAAETWPAYLRPASMEGADIERKGCISERRSKPILNVASAEGSWESQGWLF